MKTMRHAADAIIVKSGGDIRCAAVFERSYKDCFNHETMQPLKFKRP